VAQHEAHDVDQMVHQTLLGDAWDNARIAVAVFDDDRNYIAFNTAFCELTGYTRAELAALRRAIELVADDASRHALTKVIRDGEEAGSVNLRRKDGTVVPVAFWAQETTVAGLPYYISLVWEMDKAMAALDRLRRSIRRS
jgi:PAS domain S-box-containing protein